MSAGRRYRLQHPHFEPVVYQTARGWGWRLLDPGSVWGGEFDTLEQVRDHMVATMGNYACGVGDDPVWRRARFEQDRQMREMVERHGWRR